MSDVKSNSNQIKVLALGVTAVLHGLVGYGLASMQMPELKPLKITPPIEVQIIKPKIEEVVVNNLESPEPPKPVAAPKVEKKPDPRPAPTKPKKVEPKPEPKVKPEPKPEIKKTEPKVEPKPDIKKVEPKVEPPPEIKPDVRQAEILAAERAAAQAKWEAEQRAEADRRNREKAEAEARLAAEKARQAAAEKARAEAEAAAKKSQATSNEGRGTGNTVGEMTLSASKVAASWKKKPNFSNVDAGDRQTSAVKFTVNLVIDEKGRIVSATGVSTGLGRNVDRQIERAIKSASFHPFKDENGNPVRGKATLPMSFSVN
ncbi:hypothetical protein [Moraxella oculi]|uniref:Protein TolA n=1 Tax=Moraxella oculi TaxID=2940516 RepID=A0ABW8U3T6_9GAMM